MNVFNAYATYYDLFYENKDYKSEAEYVATLLKKFAPQCKSVLELGCGTGGHAEHLATMGYSLLGIDLSPVMLERARARKEELTPDVGQRLEFSEGDIRNFKSGNKFDAAVSLFHVFSYQQTDSDLTAALETAARHLPSGGTLIFDYWFGPAVLSQKPEVRERTLENSEYCVTRKAEPLMVPDKNLVKVHFTVKVNSKASDAVESLEETHNMRYLFLEEIENAAKPWFSTDAHYGWKKQTQPDNSDWAAVTVLKRL